jgi:hypothetical protein
MSFLGKLAASGAARFLSHAGKATRFLGQNANNISKISRGVASFASNPSVQRAGASIGIKPRLFQQASGLASSVGQIAGNATSISSAANNLASNTRKDIGSLYAAVNRSN